jgi:hypothetical protein
MEQEDIQWTRKVREEAYDSNNNPISRFPTQKIHNPFSARTWYVWPIATVECVRDTVCVCGLSADEFGPTLRVSADTYTNLSLQQCGVAS